MKSVYVRRPGLAEDAYLKDGDLIEVVTYFDTCPYEIGVGEIVSDGDSFWQVNPRYLLNTPYWNKKLSHRDVKSPQRLSTNIATDEYIEAYQYQIEDFRFWQAPDCHFRILNPSPNKDRLLKYLFDQKFQIPDGLPISELRTEKLIGDEEKLRDFLGHARRSDGERIDVLDSIVLRQGNTKNARYSINPNVLPGKPDDPISPNKPSNPVE